MADSKESFFGGSRHSRHDDRMRGDFDRDNLQFTRDIAIGLGVFNVVSLIVLPLITPEREVLVNSGVCAAFCVVALLAAHVALKREKIPHALAQAIVIGFYVVLTVWGIMVSLHGYLMGRQIITFYAVEIALVGSIVLPPHLETTLLVASYATMYLTIYASTGEVPNLRIDSYILIALVSIFVGIARYASRVRELDQRYEVEELNEKLRGDSRRDALTGLQNRLGLRESFSGYVGDHVYVVMFDVDHLKTINDGFGHAAGDAALVAVAGTIHQAFGDVDTFRYGGDEFLAIVPAAEGDEMFDQRVRDWLDDVASLRLDEMDGGGLSCGYGVADGLPTCEDDLRTLVRRADGELYKAKRARQVDR